MFWFDKNNPNVIFADNRELETELCDGRKLVIKPDEKIDFRDMPYPDNSFKLVVFDPPHLIHAGERSWLRAKYGVLPDDWKTYINQGMNECMRVLEPDGILIFKKNRQEFSVTCCRDELAMKRMLHNFFSKMAVQKLFFREFLAY